MKHIAKPYLVWLTALPFLLLLTPAAAFAQSPLIWTGSLTCQLDDQEQGVYQRQEIQTWTLNGGGPVSPIGMPEYQATWKVSGAGQLMRTQGTQSTKTAWQTNAQAPASLTIFVRSSDKRLIILSRRSRNNVVGATNASSQVMVNGALQPASSSSYSAYEWMIPHMEAGPTATTISGTGQTQTEGVPAPLGHRFGSTPPFATCQWQFTKGGSVPAQNTTQIQAGGAHANVTPQLAQNGNLGTQNNPAVTGSQSGSGTPPPSSSATCDSPATVQQSFESMKANLKSSFDTLIQGTTDPAQIASLTQQEQKTLASLTAQEQSDMKKAADNGCTGTGSQSNSPAGGAAAAGAGNSGAGATGSGSNTSPAITPPPTNITATAGDGSAVISWTDATAPAGASIQVYRVSTTSGSNSMTSHTSPVTISGLTNGTTYTFQVIAISNLPGAAYSAPAVANPVTPAANGAVASIISIDPTQEACNQYRSFTLNGQNTHFAQGVTTADFGPGVQQRALNVTGQQIHAHMFILSSATPGLHPVTITTGSEVVKTTITINTPCNPDPPNNVVGQAGDRSASLSWTAPTTTAIAGYMVTTMPDGQSTNVGNVTSWTVKGLTDGNTYTFQVKALNSAGVQSDAAISNAITLTIRKTQATLSGSSLPSNSAAVGTVSKIAQLVQVSPASALQKANNVSVTLTGRNTNFVQSTTTVDFGPGITLASPLVVAAPDSATAALNISLDAATGPRTVRLTTGTETVSLANGFTVTPMPDGISKTCANPTSVGTLSSGAITTITGSIDSSGVDDWISVSFASNADLTMKLSNVFGAGTFDMDVLSSCGGPVLDSTASQSGTLRTLVLHASGPHTVAIRVHATVWNITSPRFQVAFSAQ